MERTAQPVGLRALVGLMPAVALGLCVAACVPAGSTGVGPGVAPPARPSTGPKAAGSPAASPATRGSATPAGPAMPAVPPDAGTLLGKMKEPVGLARQTALTHAIHDGLPITLMSPSLNTISTASSLVSNNGGTLAPGGGAGRPAGFRLAQADAPPAKSIQVRSDGVILQEPETGVTGTLTIFAREGWDPSPSADNSRLVIDRFRYEYLDLTMVDATHSKLTVRTTVLKSRRLVFTDQFVLEQLGHMDDARGVFVIDETAFVLAFDVQLADGTTDRAALRLAASGDDLVYDTAPDGTPIAGSKVPRRLRLTGTNGHGTYAGALDFALAGAIAGDFTHTRLDGGVTHGELAMRPDGSFRQVARTEAGALALTAERAADAAAPVALTLQDFSGASPVTLTGVATADHGIVSFDFGTATPQLARLY